jgi:hypothetical protein
MSGEHGQILAEAIRARRIELGISQQEASERSKAVDPSRRSRPGLSLQRWSELERGMRPYGLRPSSRRSGDLTLCWHEDTTQTILDTGAVPPQADAKVVAPVQSYVKVPDEASVWFTNGKGGVWRIQDMELETVPRQDWWLCRALVSFVAAEAWK